MRPVLLDTNALLWAFEASPQLSPAAATVLDDPDTVRLLSAASLWELAIKHSIGKLRTSKPLMPEINALLERHDITVLPITGAVALCVADLPLHHRDPFDRLIVAQADAIDAELLSPDAILDAYGIRRLW